MKNILVFLFLALPAAIYSQTKEADFLKAQTHNLNNEFSDAIQILDLLIEKDSTDFALFNERGWSYLNLYEFDIAIVDFTNAIKLNPSCIECNYRLARSYYELEDFTKASEIVNHGFALSDTSALLYVVRGLINQANSENEEALKDYSEAIFLDPQCELCLIARAEFYIQNDEPILALNDLGAASKIDPKNSEYYYYRAYLLSNAGGNDDAMVEIEKALSIDNTVSKYHVMKFLIFANNNDYSSAEKCLLNALEILPDDYLIYMNLADLYSEVNMYDDYCSCIEKAALNCPEDEFDNLNFKYSKYCNDKKVGYYFLRALGYYVDGKFNECIKISKKGILVLRNSPVLSNIRGYAYIAQNEYELARQDFLTCLEDKQKLESEVIDYYAADLSSNDSEILAESYVIKAYVGLAIIELHNKQYDVALKQVNKGLELSIAIPGFDDLEILYNVKGMIYIGKNELVSAENEFNLALSENKDFSVTHLNIALLKLLMNSNYSTKKFKFEYTGQTLSTRLFLSSLKLSKTADINQLRDALEICNMVIESEHENPMAYYLKAKIQQFLNEDYCNAARKSEFYGITNTFKELGIKCPEAK